MEQTGMGSHRGRHELDEVRARWFILLCHDPEWVGEHPLREHPERRRWRTRAVQLRPPHRLDAGRLVRRLSVRTDRLAWDGADEAGRLLPAGIYFLRLEVEGAAHTAKVELLR